MKKILSITFLLLTTFQLFAQNPSDAPKKKGTLPETLFNLDLDFNRSFSFVDDLIGINSMTVKTMIGSKNTGIIVGLHSCIMGNDEFLRKQFFANRDYINSNPISINNKGFSIRLGYQKALYRGLYATVSADLTRIKADVEHNYIYHYDIELDRIIWGMRLNAGLGYTISIGRAKKFYLNYELIYSIIDKSKSTQGKLNFIGGIGFRIGSPAKTSYDGIKEVYTVPIKL